VAFGLGFEVLGLDLLVGAGEEGGEGVGGGGLAEILLRVLRRLDEGSSAFSAGRERFLGMVNEFSI
jgi:hypothetical protein